MQHTNYGILINKSTLTKEEYEKIKKELTLIPINKYKSKFGIKIQIIKYKECSENILIPRYYYNDILQKYKIVYNITLSRNNFIDIKFNGLMRDYQNEIIKQILLNFFNKNGTLKKYAGNCICIRAGGGKTVLALKLISLLKLRTLIIVHKSFLMNQWIERIKQFLPDAKVGIIQRDKIDIENKDIVIGMLQSLSMKDYETKIFEYFPLVIFDEVHHVAAETFSQVLGKLHSPYTIGLSATPNRKDNLQSIFFNYLGSLIETSLDVQIENVIVKNIFFDLKDDEEDIDKFCIIKNKFNEINMVPMLVNLTHITKRNIMITETIIETLKENRKILILSNFREHLNILYTLLTTSINVSAGFYVGGMKQEELRNSEEKNVIFATYNMASEGLDIPNLNTLIMATPKSDIIQSIGRILRKYDELCKPLIIDIVDNIFIFTNQYKKRLKIYEERNYFIK